MYISIDENAGFCSGVKHAIKIAKGLAESENCSIFCLGDIIHNNDVIEELRSKGILTVESIDQIRESDAVVIIRTHGISKDMYAQLREKGFRIVDATCVNVKKIHDLVESNHMNGNRILIIGDRNHPEITGINGWCENSAYIIENEEGVDGIPFSHDDRIAVFSQTTFEINKYRKIIDKLRYKFKNLQEFDTICRSTRKRQDNARELSMRSDIMIVLGGERSSNTKKLFDICSTNCKETYLAENLSKLPKGLDLKNKKIGITAGASTPANVIEEVFNFMNDSASIESDKEISFEDAVSKSSMKLSSGTIVKGKVLSKTDTEAYVDVSYKSDGILPIEEFSDIEDFISLQAGDETEVYITRVNDSEGYVLLSKKRVDNIRSSDTVKIAYEEKKPIKVKIKNTVKGGVIASYKGFDIFIPASQVSDTYIKDLSSLIGNTVDVEITELDIRRKRAIGSGRIILEREKDELIGKFWDEIEVGKTYEGTVKSFVDFGAFVNIGPMDGLLHISEMSWLPLKHPSEMFSVSQKIDVFVLSFNKEKKKVSLGYKRSEDDPWFSIGSRIAENDEIDVKIVRIVPFGAFAEIYAGVEGLIHISNISDKKIGHPAEVLRIDQVVRTKVIEIDPANRRIALSIKDLIPVSAEDIEEITGSHSEDMDVTLADIMDLDKKENVE